MSLRLTHYLFLLTIGFSLAAAHSAFGGNDLIGEFRIGSNTYPDYTTLETWSEPTRSVIDAPVQVNSTFSGLSQNADMVPDPDPGDTAPGTDTQLRTFTVNTHIRTLNRFAVDQDGPGGSLGPQRSGAVQWKFDLTPIDSYLSNNSLELTELDLDFVTTVSDAGKKYDILLSYTNVAENIALTDIDTTITNDANTGGPRQNYNNIWLPLHDANADEIPGDFDSNFTVEGADLPLWETGYGTAVGAGIGDGDANGDGDSDGQDYLVWQRRLGEAFTGLPEEGDIYGGSFRVLGKDRTGDLSAGALSESLLSLYQDGVREFNLIVQSGEFLSGRLIRIESGAGLSITTVPALGAASVPEPSSILLTGIGLLGLLSSGRRRRVDAPLYCIFNVGVPGRRAALPWRPSRTTVRTGTPYSKPL